MKYFSIDIETSGLDWDTCQVIEFAAVFEDTSIDTPLEELPTFHSYVLPYDGETIRGEPYALRMNVEIIGKIADFMQAHKNVSAKYLGGVHDGDSFLPSQQMVADFRCWMHSVAGISTANFAGKNLSGFDLRFLEKIDGWKDIKYHHRIVEPTMGFWNPLEDEVMPNLDTCLSRSGVDKIVTHKALDDSFDVIQTIRYIKKART